MNFNLIDGNIITLDQSNPIANSVTIENDKIVNIDNINSKYQNIDLCGATVIPGFVDSHFHLTLQDTCQKCLFGALVCCY